MEKAGELDGSGGLLAGRGSSFFNRFAKKSLNEVVEIVAAGKVDDLTGAVTAHGLTGKIIAEEPRRGFPMPRLRDRR